VDWKIPVVVVQHMPAGFTQSLALRLNEASEVEVVEVTDGELLTPGKIFIAKGGSQLKFSGDAAGKVVLRLTDDPPKISADQQSTTPFAPPQPFSGTAHWH
jgi:two-component system chemotaxis response regulator CheB